MPRNFLVEKCYKAHHTWPPKHPHHRQLRSQLYESRTLIPIRKQGLRAEGAK